MSNDLKRVKVAHQIAYDILDGLKSSGKTFDLPTDAFIKSMRDSEKMFQNFNAAADAGKKIVAEQDQALKSLTEFHKIVVSRLADAEKIIIDEKAVAESNLNRIMVETICSVEANHVPRIEMPPGTWMTSLSALIFSKKTRERVFNEIVADYRQEFYEAISEGTDGKMLFMLHARYWIAFCLAVFMQIASTAAKVIQVFKSAG